LDAPEHGLAGDLDEAAGKHRGLADEEHLAGIAVEAVLDDGDVHIDDVAAFQALVARDSVADLVIHRGADRFWETPIVQRRRYRPLDPGDEVMADGVELVRGHPGLDVLADHVQHVGGQAPGDAHALDGLGCLDLYAHRRTGCVHIGSGSL